MGNSTPLNLSTSIVLNIVKHVGFSLTFVFLDPQFFLGNPKKKFILFFEAVI